MSAATLSLAGTGQKLSFSATSSNPNFTLSAVSDQPGTASVIQTAPGQFSVSAGNAGTCTITVTDTGGAHAGVVVTVTTFPVTVN